MWQETVTLISVCPLCFILLCRDVKIPSLPAFFPPQRVAAVVTIAYKSPARALVPAKCGAHAHAIRCERNTGRQRGRRSISGGSSG